MDDPAWPSDGLARWRQADAATPSSGSGLRDAVPGSAVPGLVLPGLALRYAPEFTDPLAMRGIEPYAVLVNKAKADAAHVSRWTLAGLAARGLRLRLPINVGPDNGDTGWIHPLFAEYTGWSGRCAADLPDLFLDLAALDGMKRLRETLLGGCELMLVAAGQALHADLLDPAQPERVAAWCNPLRLFAELQRQGRALHEFEVVSLQRFMGLSAPSLFRAAALPLPPLLYQYNHQAVPADAHVLAELPHDAAFYARLPQLGFIADTPLMSSLALNLLRPEDTGLEPSPSSCGAAGRVYLAAAAAHYEMARHVHRLRGTRAGSAPSSKPATPALKLA